MSLRWDARNVKNWEEINIKPRFVEMFAFYSMFFDMGGIRNEKDVTEFAIRYKLYTLLFGHMYTVVTKDGLKPYEITLDEMKSMIGFTVNVRDIPFSTWKNRMIANWRKEKERELLKELKSLDTPEVV